VPSFQVRLGIAAAGGLALLVLLKLIVWRIRVRRERDLAAEAPRQPLLAFFYGENAHRRSRNRAGGGLPVVLGAPVFFAEGVAERFEIYLVGGLAALTLPAAWNDLHDIGRGLTVGPVVAAYEEGLSLSGWRRTTFLRWAEVAAVYTDPPQADGYVAEEANVILYVEAKDGRSWRFSRFDFEEGAATQFAEMVAIAALRAAPPGSMLTG
jgi:hypothetical protein